MLETLRRQLGTDRIPANLSHYDVFCTHTYRRTRHPFDGRKTVVDYVKCAIALVNMPTVRQRRRCEAFYEDITFAAIPVTTGREIRYAVMRVSLASIPPGMGYFFHNKELQKLQVTSQRSPDGLDTFSKHEALCFMEALEEGGKLSGFPDAALFTENPTTHWSRSEIQPTGRRHLKASVDKWNVLVRMPPGGKGTIKGVWVHTRPPSPAPFHHLRHRRMPVPR